MFCVEVEWTSYNIGIFICESCASIHRSLGAHISKVKSIKLDLWEEDQVKASEQIIIHVLLNFRVCDVQCIRQMVSLGLIHLITNELIPALYKQGFVGFDIIINAIFCISVYGGTRQSEG